MVKESRVKKSFLNARMNLICYMASLVVAFFTRKVFLDQLGTEFIGLTGTLQSLLGFLNLAELGVGTAIGYVLYKPIFDDDKSKINEIISVFGYLYRYIGLVILGAGIILSAFLPWIFPDTTFSWGVIYFGFYAYLASSMLGYFVNYRMTLLSADQKNYIVTGYFQLTSTTKVILQMILAIYVHSFYLYLAIEIIFGIINSIILNIKINKTYPWLESDIKLGRQLFKKYPEIGKYVKQLFVHKIGSFVQFQISPFLIYTFVSLPMVALYGNYTLITQRVQSFISGILDSTSAGIGNLISEGNKEKIYLTYKELFAFRFCISGILSCCIFFSITPFISLWLNQNYILSNTIVLLATLHFFLYVLRGTTDQFLFGYGLFYDTWAPIVESILFVLTSIILGMKWGLIGVLYGPIVSMGIIVYIWKPFFLYNKGFKKTFRNYISLFVSHLIIIVVSYFISLSLLHFFIQDNYISETWKNWILGVLFFTIVMTVTTFSLFYITSLGMRTFINRFLKVYINKSK